MDENLNGWTQPICNQELCANVNSTSSQPRGLCQPKHYMFIFKRYVPIGNWNNMRPHILNSIWHFFNLNLVYQISCLRSFLPLGEKNCIFHPNLLAPSLLWLPSICNCYTSILQWQNKKITRMVTPNTLQIMIEYTLISSILDRICKMKTKPLE
jgi:hypothetical protein